MVLIVYYNIYTIGYKTPDYINYSQYPVLCYSYKKYFNYERDKSVSNIKKQNNEP